MGEYYINQDGILKQKVSMNSICLSVEVPDKKYKYSGKIDNNTYIKEVIYNNPATIVIWNDGTKTVSKCHKSDVYSEEFGLTICILKKILGSTNLKNIFNVWLPEVPNAIVGSKVTLKDVIKKEKESGRH